MHRMTSNETISGTSILNDNDFVNCAFKNCSFAGQDLSKFNFESCEFIGCDLTMCKMENTAYSEVVFNDCKLQGVEFGKCSKYVFSVTFEKCVLNYAVFLKNNLKKLRFVHCSIREAFFAECDLTQALFDNCDFEMTSFERCNLSGCDFRTSWNYIIIPSQNKLKKAKFAYPGVLGLLADLDIVVE